MTKNETSKYALAGLACAVIIFVLVIAGRATCSGKDKIPESESRKETGYKNLEYTRVGKTVSSEDVAYEGFQLSFNKDTRVPNWVGWELLGSETEGAVSRSDKFWQDSNVDGCASLDDYRRSGYDRGHMCPSADQKWSETAMHDCFALTNIAPQTGALNRGAWQTLEQKSRLWAKRDSALVIVAGPIFNSDEINVIGNGVRVPDAFFKVILAPYVERPRAIGFVYPNMSAPGNMQNYVMTVDDIEALTGFDFFSGLPDDIENEVEAVASFKEWVRR